MVMPIWAASIATFEICTGSKLKQHKKAAQDVFR